MLTMPDAFFRERAGFALPEAGCYAVAMIFGGVGAEAAVEGVIAEEGASVLGWREVPVVPEAIGRKARENRPAIRQLFIDGRNFADNAAFERKLFVMRRRIEKLYGQCGRTKAAEGKTVEIPVCYGGRYGPDLSFVAENARTNIRQRQAEGIAAAKARGVRFGRPPKPLPENYHSCYQRWKAGKITGTAAAKECGMPLSTFRYRAAIYEKAKLL